MKRASAEAKEKQPSFSSDLMPLVISVFSRFGVRQLPTPLKFQHTLSQVATYEFFSPLPSRSYIRVYQNSINLSGGS